MKEGAAPDAARKLRLEATNTLAMVQRLAANWKPAIRRALTVAQMLEQALPLNSTAKFIRYNGVPISVKPRDGLPIDTLDQAQEISLLRGASLLSDERGVGLLIEDKAEGDAEVARLAERQANTAPSAFFGGHGGGA